MKTWIAGLGLLLSACQGVEGQLQLIETAPIETSLGSPDIEEFHELWRAWIDEAQQSIDLAHFYASDREGSRLQPIVSALEAAASRGVRVRFLADAGFYRTYPETLDRLDSREGIEVRQLDLRDESGGVLHAKSMIVDGQRVCVGSANFDWRALEHIQELGVALQSAQATAGFAEVFELDWQLAGGEAAPAGLDQVVSNSRATPASFPCEWRSGEIVQVTPVFSPKGLLPDPSRWDLPQLLHWIDAAQSEIRVQLLTLRLRSRDGELFEELDSALRRAAARGVSVRFLLADWGKRRGTLEGLQELVQVPGIDMRFVSLPEASEGFIPFARVIHSKYMVVDGARAWVGTSNWERSYFYEGRNAGLLIEGSGFARRLEQYFDQGWNSSYSEVVSANRSYEAPRVGE